MLTQSRQLASIVSSELWSPTSYRLGSDMQAQPLLALASLAQSHHTFIEHHKLLKLFVSRRPDLHTMNVIQKGSPHIPSLS